MLKKILILWWACAAPFMFCGTGWAQASTVAPALAEVAAVPPAPAEVAEAPEPSFFSKYPFSLSGFLKFDALFSSARLNSNDAPRFAALEPLGTGTDSQFSATVQHSRIRGAWDGPDAANCKVDAYIEMDLFTLGDTGDAKFNNNQLRLRQLYVDLDFRHVKFRVGETWDLFSPLGPGTLNTNGYYWFGGNAGFRRPQVQFSKEIDLQNDHRLFAAFSINSNIGRTRTVGGRTVNSGEASGVPVFEAQLAYDFPTYGSKQGTIGVSGLWGLEDADGIDSDIKQQAVGFHLKLPLADYLTVKGEVQYGVNTDAFLMGGGFDATGDEVEAVSGWIELAFKPPVEALKNLSVSLLFGLEDLASSNVAPGGRERNQVMGLSAKYKIVESVVLGLEYQRFDTDYVGVRDEQADMLWTSLILNF